MAHRAVKELRFKLCLPLGPMLLSLLYHDHGEPPQFPLHQVDMLFPFKWSLLLKRIAFLTLLFPSSTTPVMFFFGGEAWFVCLT